MQRSDLRRITRRVIPWVGARALRGKYQWLCYSYIALLTGLASNGATWLAQLYAGIA